MQDHEPSFFDRLVFDPRLKETLIARYFANVRAIALIVATLSGAGLATYFSLPRELNPNIQIPIVFVTTVFPGAGPEDIEALVTEPLEKSLAGLSGSTKVSSTSKENVSAITVEFTSSTNPDKAKDDVRNAIDSVTTLPEDAETPVIQILDFQNQPALTFALASRSDAPTLGPLADDLRDRLEDVPGIERVSLSYRQDPEMTITITPETLEARGLSLLAMSASVKSAISNYPSGALGTRNTSFALTADRAAENVESLRELPIHVSGETWPLGTLSTVREMPAPNQPLAWYADEATTPKRAILFTVFADDNADTTTTVGALLDEARAATAPLGDDIVIEPIFNGAKEIQKSFDQLFRDFFITVGLVFLILFVFFGLRQSVIAALAIPLTFLGTFLVMQATDISINFISLFSLILALGILVDNAIVVISALSSYERTEKFTPAEAALLVWRDFKSVIFTTTITTVWAFLPLLLASGIIGEFIRPIPVVVSSALAISAAIALFLVLPLMATFVAGHFPRRVLLATSFGVFLVLSALLYFALPDGSYKTVLFVLALVLLFFLMRVFGSARRELTAYEESHFARLAALLHRLAGNGLFDFHPLSRRYERFIRRVVAEPILRRRTLSALIIFSLFSYALVPLGYVINEFFPNDDQEIAFVSVELPPGTGLAESEQRLRELVESLRMTDETRFVMGEVGVAAPTDNSSTAREFNTLLFTLLFTPAKERDLTSSDLVARLNEQYGAYPHGKLSALQISGGPPAGSDLQLSLLGEDLDTLQTLAARVSDYLKSVPGASNISTSITSGTSKIVFTPRLYTLADKNIREDELAVYLRMLGSGFTVKSDVRFGEDERDVVLRFSDNLDLNHPENLGRLSFPVGDTSLPFLALGDFRLEPNPTLITREDGRRTIVISASVSEGFSVSTLNQELERFAETELGLPAGYSWRTGGVNEENERSVQSILQAMLLSAILIFGTMALQFHSFRKALIVLLVIPLAVSGVFIVFALTGTPLSFPSLIGILALFGIVVNNSIIMVDKINRNMEDATLSTEQAIAEGAASRLEPILLTALTTIVGLVPITLADPIWRGLGGAIIAGLTFSGVAKLFFIPVMYAVWFGQSGEQSSSVMTKASVPPVSSASA